MIVVRNKNLLEKAIKHFTSNTFFTFCKSLKDNIRFVYPDLEPDFLDKIMLFSKTYHATWTAVIFYNIFEDVGIIEILHHTYIIHYWCINI